MYRNIIIVGVGALGSHLVQFLRNVDAKIRIIDFDKVEVRNIQSQFHAKNSTGKPKVQALGQLMQFLFGLKIETISNKLHDKNINILLCDADLIIDCLDNAESRIIVQNFAKKNNIACLHGALSADGDFGRVVWDNLFNIDKEPGEGAATCENGEHLPFIGLSAAILAQSAKKYLDTGEMVSYHISPGGVLKI